MRVISQENTIQQIDIPYETFVISQLFIDPTIIIAYKDTENDSYVRMAKYSTPEKARKAMNMLHSYYGDYMIENVYGMWPVFQFPQDDEI